MSLTATRALFEPNGEFVVPTVDAGSPWSEGLVHGGPVAGLVARSLLAHPGTDGLLLTRTTVNLFRPVPMRPLEVVTRSVGGGRRVRVVYAEVHVEGLVVTTATGLFLRPDHATVPAQHIGLPPRGLPSPDTIQSHAFDLPAAPRGFHTIAEVRPVPGRRAAWFRHPPVMVRGDAASPVVAAVAVADFANAVGAIRVPDGRGYINTDVTVQLDREPRGDWVGIDVLGQTGSTGLGWTTSTLWDVEGPIGAATQTLLCNAPIAAVRFRRITGAGPDQHFDLAASQQ